jgi:hypothetical protein
LGLGISPRQEVVDLAGAVSVDDPCERVAEIGVGIDVVKLAGRPAFRAAVRILAVENDR